MSTSTMLRHAWHQVLSVFVIFLCSCSTQIPTTPPISIPATPSLSMGEPLTTPSFQTNIPESSKTPLPMATQFCMGYLSSWSCRCGDLPLEEIQIKTADQAGACEISLPHAYRIRLSDDWYCHTAGASRINLSCVTAYGQRIFVQVVRSELALADADETINRVCEGGGCSSDPVIDPDEERIEKELLTIGDKPVLRVSSQQEETFLLRYFIRNNENLYVFKVESKDPTETKANIFLLEETIQSMEFVP